MPGLPPFCKHLIGHCASNEESQHQYYGTLSGIVNYAPSHDLTRRTKRLPFTVAFPCLVFVSHFGLDTTVLGVVLFIASFIWSSYSMLFLLFLDAFIIITAVDLSVVVFFLY